MSICKIKELLQTTFFFFFFLKDLMVDPNLEIRNVSGDSLMVIAWSDRPKKSLLIHLKEDEISFDR